ncbi:MAG: aspartate-semialdehyde dehydrogenase [Oscillospiraceae bacterium]|jgi:aspartate-semialdehyde dehydrogenase|nr:aspartate-semialdehyde dehydrogenase [Oscillospiraceae bacterium]
MKQYRVGVLGAPGMVGQRFVALLAEHPWFKVTALAASARSAGKSYGDLMEGRWALDQALPEAFKSIVLLDAVADLQKIAEQVDLVFCAVDMKNDEIRQLEDGYAKAECPVISNNGAHRGTPDVPMIVPELNAAHAEVIPAQRKRLGTKRGFVAVKSNCSLQSYVPALFPLEGVQDVLVCTYQAISGAGKTFRTWPEMVDNVIPFIGGEEAKSEQEPLKLYGKVEGAVIVNAALPRFTAQCLRVAASDGHMAAVFVRFAPGKKPAKEEILKSWREYRGAVCDLNLPSAPKQFLHYFEEENLPQTKLQRNLENGMAVSIGRLREDTQYDYKFVCLSHNTLRGAAGGAVLMAEQLCAQGYIL